MAQYKVLQDIEAEDKLLGPLSLRQFIYAAITIVLGFIAFKIFTSSAWIIGFIFLPPAMFFGLLAAPIGDQQSSEIWLLAKIRFFLKPRKRIWDQSGIQDLVTITVPKKIEKQLTKGYSQEEVKSRLKTLATTLDTRGWVIKNASGPFVATGYDSDRLLDISAQSIPSVFVEPSADMLDAKTNPRAQAMDQMISQSAQQHKQEVMDNIKKYSVPKDQPQPATITNNDEQNLLNQLHKRMSQPSEMGTHMKNIKPPSELAINPQATTPKQSVNSVTPKTDPAILNIVKNSKGLSVKTIAGQADRVKNKGSDDEVVISLR